MKKILALFLAFAMIFSFVSPVLAENSYDQAGLILKDLGLLQGNAQGDLGLDANLYRKHMVVLISRLYGEAEEASKFVGVNKFKDLTPKHEKDIPYITWAVDKGLIEGKGDGTFGIDDYVTVQQYQTVLLRALGYEKDAEHWDMVPGLAQAYGLMTGVEISPSAKMNRGAMAAMTVNALRQEKNGETKTLADFLKVEVPDAFEVDVTATVENNNIVFQGQASGSENLWIQIKPISSNIQSAERLSPVPTDSDGNFLYEVKNLEVGEYHYRFKSGELATQYKSLTITVLPFKFIGLTADNLKEVHLTFTQPVDKAIMSLKSNYTTSAGPIKDIRFEDNDKKVVITLEGTMIQQMKYKISAMKIRSKSGEEESLKDYEFEAIDLLPPEVISINQLGNKGLRIYFSEPLKTATVNDFKIDGKNFNGSVKHENNVVTLTYFSSLYALSEGKHLLKISGIKDFNGYSPVKSEYDLVISKDLTAPKLVTASSTLNTVTVEFDKDIDPVYGLSKNIYWKIGSNKIFADSILVDGKKIIASFKNSLSTSNNLIYLENVVDYSGNKASVSVDVVPLIDTTSPEVIHHTVSKDGRTITVYFSKNVSGKNTSNYSILDEKEKTVNIRSVEGSGSEYRINLYSALPIGVNTLMIQGVEDTSPLKNTVIPFSTKIVMEDIEKARLTNSTGYANNIILYFSKVMDMSLVTNPNNYIMTYKGVQETLPVNSSFKPSDDGKSVAIILPENHDGSRVMIGERGNLTRLDIIGLKDVVGNETNPLIVNVIFDASSTGKAKAVDYYSERPGRQGVLLESNLIKVKFNLPIVQASKDDFKLTGRKISNIIADGSPEVTILLEDMDSTSMANGVLTIVDNNNMKTSIDTGVEASTILLYDRVAPRVKSSTSYLNVYGNQIEIPFTETLEDEVASLFRRDLEVIRLEDGKTLSSDTDYSTALKASDKSIIVVTINRRDISSGYSLRLSGEYNNDNLSYIIDKDGNRAVSSIPYFTSRDIPKQ